MARVVVCGYMMRHPVAGNMLAYFHYLLGLSLLGHEVVYLEESGWPGACYDPESHVYSDDPLPGLRRVRSLLAAHSLNIPVCYVNRHTGDVSGASWAEAKMYMAEADLLLNLGGVCWLPEFRLCKRLALVDMDPLFTQVGRFAAEGLVEYNNYFSYGTNIGREGCGVPTLGINWLSTLPPVVPQIWPLATPSTAAPFTTVANWRAYGSITHEGECYGQKDVEFMRILDLPQRTTETLELALSGINPPEASLLRKSGWNVRDGDEVSLDISRYASYIAGSRGEFSVAKNGYVKARTGWLSDRSVCYLAAGLPVVLQDTGFSDWLPAGKGVLAFSSIEDAARCIALVGADYEGHRAAALRTAEQVFSYKVTLTPLLETCLRPAAVMPPAGGGGV